MHVVGYLNGVFDSLGSGDACVDCVVYCKMGLVDLTSFMGDD